MKYFCLGTDIFHDKEKISISLSEVWERMEEKSQYERF